MRGSDKISEIGELKTIIGSRALRRILQQSKAYHQRKVNEHVKAQNLISAFGEVSKCDYIDKLWEIIQKECEKMTKEANDGRT